jgi:Uma2 family endonuclease
MWTKLRRLRRRWRNYNDDDRRVPVVLEKPSGRIITEPPFIVIEALSPEDRAYRMQEKITEYLDFGVTNIWVIDPETKTAVACTQTGVVSISEGSLRASSAEIELPLSELF